MSILDELTITMDRSITNNHKILIDSLFARKNEWLIPNDPDPFEIFAREVRVKRGIIDPPRQPACGGGQPTHQRTSVSGLGQILSENFTWEEPDIDKS